MLRILKLKKWRTYAEDEMDFGKIFPQENPYPNVEPCVAEGESYFLGLVQGILFAIDPLEEPNRLCGYSCIAAKLVFSIENRKINTPDELMEWLCTNLDITDNDFDAISIVSILNEILWPMPNKDS